MTIIVGHQIWSEFYIYICLILPLCIVLKGVEVLKGVVVLKGVELTLDVCVTTELIFGCFVTDFNSSAFGTAPRGRLTFKGFFGNFLTFQSLRPKNIIPTKTTFSKYVLYRLPSKFTWADKNSLLTGRFANFSQSKFKIKRLSRFQMTAKPYYYVECYNDTLLNICTASDCILNRYIRFWPLEFNFFRFSRKGPSRERT